MHKAALSSLTVFIIVLFASTFSWCLNETVVCRGSYYLDLESSSNKTDILYCFIDSDSETGFTVEFDFNGTTADVSNGSESQSFTSLYVIVPTNTDLASGLNHLEYGVGATEITSAGVAVTLDGDGKFSITTDDGATANSTCGGGSDLCTTSGLLVKVAASWSGATSLFSGFYKEKVSISITAK